MKVVWLMLSLLTGIALTKACGETLATMVSDVFTTASFTVSNASNSLWRHKLILPTMIPTFMNSSTVLIQESTDSTSTTQQPSISINGVSSATIIASTATSSLESYSQPILDQHNKHRANCSTLPLTWSSDLANIAAQIASSCVYAHDTTTGGGGFGQNIGAGAEPLAVPALITNEMYNNEIGWYPIPYGDNNPDMTNFEKWGHYSQIVWNSTTDVGCATQYCPNGLTNTGSDISPYFTVCNYFPPGNVAGFYNNVGDPVAGLASIDLPE